MSDNTELNIGDLPAVQEAGFYDAGELLAAYKILKTRYDEQILTQKSLLGYQQQAEAWEAIFMLLQKIEPDWLGKADCAHDAALVTIRESVEKRKELEDVLGWIAGDYLDLIDQGATALPNWRQRVARAEVALGHRL